MEKYRSLQTFLVKKFLKIILLVSVAEYGIIVILNHTLVPIVMYYFFRGADTELIGIVSLIIILFVLMGNILGEFVKLLIPPQLTTLSDIGSGALMRSLGMTDKSAVSALGTKEELLLMLILLGMLIIIAIPYIVGAFAFIRIVIKEMDKLAEEEKSQLYEYNEQKNLMLSDIAHDLRTPMTTVSGYSRALLDDMVSEDKKQEYLEAINVKSDRMNNLINLLFDYVRLDSKGFSLNKKDEDICELVREAAAFQYQDIEDAGMELDVEIPEEKALFSLDKLQVSRVITNLITNAIRHNKSGTAIGLFVTIEDDYVRVMVADNGDLIPEEMAETIFDAFVMGDESRSSKGGSGLGLSIARKIVEMHGWNIRLVQKPLIKKYHVAASYEKMFMVSLPR